MRLFIICLILLVTSCNNNKSNSSLNWGHIDYKEDNVEIERLLMSVLPNETLEVCGVRDAESKHIKIAEKSILTWAAAINREKFIKFKPCHIDLNENESINVEEDFPNIIQVDVNNNRSGGYAFLSQRKIEIGGDYEPPGDYKFTILHEIGHLWGLCDQYWLETLPGNEGAGTHVTNCDIKHSSLDENGNIKIEHNSIMGGGSNDHLTNDDITSITKLSSRDDIPANKIWKEFFQNQNGSVKPPDQEHSLAKGDYFIKIGSKQNEESSAALLKASSKYDNIYICINDEKTCLNDKEKGIALEFRLNTEDRKIFETPIYIELKQDMHFCLYSKNSNEEKISLTEFQMIKKK